MEIVEKSIVCKRPALPDETSGLDGAFAFRLPVDFFWATVPDEWFLLELTAIDSQPPHFKPERRKNSFEARHSINTKANEIKSSLFYLFVLPAQETVSQFLFCHLWKRSATRNPLLLKDYGFPPGDCGKRQSKLGFPPPDFSRAGFSEITAFDHSDTTSQAGIRLQRNWFPLPRGQRPGARRSPFPSIAGGRVGSYFQTIKKHPRKYLKCLILFGSGERI
ncbi:MAG: hypothetical protein GX874_13730 [Smithella sp.]|nr:hypothetical protein [Smithella sp.]